MQILTRNHSSRRTAVAIALPGLALALVAACGTSGNSRQDAAGAGTSTAAAGPAANGPHNAADVTFATDMIPHHAQAVEMADMALGKASDGEVKTLAAAIKGAQDPEIVKMTGWLKGWAAPVPATGSGDAMHMGTGMMSQSEMGALDQASGPAFDRMWVDMMTRHHQGAVEMAKAELAQGQNGDAKTLANEVTVAQTVEIAKMADIGKRLA